MTFSSPDFPVFLLVTLLVYFSLSGNLARKTTLLIASVIFYAAWDYRYLALLFFVIAAAWGGVAILGFLKNPHHRMIVVTVAVSLQLAGLIFFKYFVFISNNLSALVTSIGYPGWGQVFDVALPIGLSFYIFHSISLLVDCYRRKLDSATPTLLDVALYIAFFPQLVSGPIVRSTDFLPQLETSRNFNAIRAERAISLILVGYTYKFLFSDTIATIIDPVFADPSKWGRIALWTAAIGYYSQIYFDFAGYTNIAIGVSAILGYDLPKNFDFPYGAASITDFWRRWHMSLSFWLRDYLFIPLGGSRGSFGFYLRNIMITMMLGGLWHGASWNFLVWGTLHGAGLGVHKAWLTFRASRGCSHTPMTPVLLLAGLVVTQLWVLSLWLFFRLPEFFTATNMLGAMFGVAPAGSGDMSVKSLLVLACPIVLDTVVGCVFIRRSRQIYFGTWVFGATAGAVLAVIIFAIAMNVKPFIYFQF